MDINNVRSFVTLLSFGLFVALMAWTCWPSRKQALHEASMLPFEGESEGLGDAAQGVRR